MKKYLSAILLILSSSVFSQNILNGKITDENNNPVKESQVYIYELKKTIYTKENGNFSIENISKDSLTLNVFSYGYSSKKIKIDIKNTNFVNIVLSPLEYSSAEVVITATKNAIKKIYSPISVDLIDIGSEYKNTESLSETIKQNSSIFVKDYGGSGGIKTVSVRGSTSEQVLVLLDGIRINSISNSQFDFSILPVGFIKKIEIAKGGNSSLYGTDATGGVINIVPISQKNISGNSISAETVFGSYNYNNQKLSLSGKKENFFYLAQFENMKSDGDFKYNYNGIVRERKNSKIARKSLFLRFGSEFGSNSEIYVNSVYSGIERGVPGPVGISYQNAKQNDKLCVNSLTYKTKFAGLNARFKAFHNFQNLKYVNKLLNINSVFSSYSGGIRLDFSKLLTNSDFSNLGLSIDREKVNTTNYNGKSRAHFSIHYSHTKKIGLNSRFFEKLYLYPSVRVDKYGKDSYISPKLGINLSREESCSFAFRSSIGKSIRIPSFNDLYWKPGGNPELKPERSLTLDTGYSFTVNRTFYLSIEQSLFGVSYLNLIIWQPSKQNPDIWESKNYRDVFSKGVETYIEFKPTNSIHLSFNHIYNLTYLNNKENPNYKNQIIYRPREIFNFNIFIKNQIAGLSFYYNRIGVRFISVDNKFWLPAFSTLDISLSKPFKLNSFKFNFSVRVKNITDVRYELLKGYPAPGRELFFNLKLQKGGIEK